MPIDSQSVKHRPLSLPALSSQAGLMVRQVMSRRDRERFLRLPWSLYGADRGWVPPILMQLRERLSPRRNPYFRHADVACFIAERSGTVVGRISAQVCELVQRFQGAGTGHFGLFECENVPDTARALFSAAETWLAANGMSRVLGPFDLSINDEVGMLVDGFEHPPFVLMGHHQPYYRPLLETIGLQKEIDLHAYFLDISQRYTDRIERIVRRASRDTSITIQAIEKKDFDRELRIVLDIFRESWADNWGYVPPTDDEVEHLIRQIRPLLDRGSMVVADVNGERAGFMIVLPNLNEFIADLDGKLLPLGWLRLLWRLRFAKFQSVRVPLMGIRKKHQNTRLGASIALAMIDRCRTRFLPQGVERCEMSWVLESNAPMRGILDAAGCEPYKRYRIFSKEVTAN
jgi:hypothetical protein